MAERKEAGMSEHTPGPWSVEPDDRPVERFSGEAGNPGTYIAGYNIVSASAEIVGCEGILSDGEANARLIAAAPEMLTALHHIVECFGVTHKDLYAIQKAHDAIDKAEGREPPHA